MVRHKKMKKMKDLKNIIIIALLAGVIIFAAIVFYGGDSGYEYRVNALQKENAGLKVQRDSIDATILVLESKYKLLAQKESALSIDIGKRDSEIAKAKIAAVISKGKLEKIQMDLTSTQKQIAELEQNPSNRDGDDLLNSIKLKTQIK